MHVEIDSTLTRISFGFLQTFLVIAIFALKVLLVNTFIALDGNGRDHQRCINFNVRCLTRNLVSALISSMYVSRLRPICLSQQAWFETHLQGYGENGRLLRPFLHPR